MSGINLCKLLAIDTQLNARQSCAAFFRNRAVTVEAIHRGNARSAYAGSLNL
jgi:hypothetical protein